MSNVGDVHDFILLLFCLCDPIHPPEQPCPARPSPQLRSWPRPRRTVRVDVRERGREQRQRLFLLLRALDKCDGEEELRRRVALRALVACVADNLSKGRFGFVDAARFGVLCRAARQTPPPGCPRVCEDSMGGAGRLMKGHSRGRAAQAASGTCRGAPRRACPAAPPSYPAASARPTRAVSPRIHPERPRCEP